MAAVEAPTRDLRNAALEAAHEAAQLANRLARRGGISDRGAAALALFFVELAAAYEPEER